jgi:uncharacterized protein (DUF1015 family)
MARIYPFRALHYNPSIVRLEDVVTQPYDKITPAMQQAYFRRSPYNLVRIILGLPQLFDGPDGENVYTRAARDFSEWRQNGILTQQADSCVFAYSQRFTIGGQALERRGFIALGELYDYSQRVVFRHEQTLDRPRSDRLKLLQATRAHFGQIFMLYSDPACSADRLLFDSAGSTDFEVIDEYGVLHRLWRVSDPATLNMLTTALEDKKLIIADGHHRYETALTYARERASSASPAPLERSSSAVPQPPYPESAAMMTFVNMDSPGLVILPTHRVVYGLAGFDPRQFLQRAEQYFRVQPLQPFDAQPFDAQPLDLQPLDLQLQDDSQTAGFTPSLEGAKEKTAFIAITAAGRHLLTAKPHAAPLTEFSERQQGLDVVQLHALVLEKLLGLTPEDIRGQRHLRYERDAAEAVSQVAGGEANAAFLLKPVTLDQLREVAFAGEVMPQKSTDFYPKMLSGLAIYALD